MRGKGGSKKLSEPKKVKAKQGGVLKNEKNRKKVIKKNRKKGNSQKKIKNRKKLKNRSKNSAPFSKKKYLK